MKGQNFASQVLSRHTFRISRKKGSDFFDHRGTLRNVDISVEFVIHGSVESIPVSVINIRYNDMEY